MLRSRRRPWLARTRWQESRVQRVAVLPSLIYCAAVPRWLKLQCFTCHAVRGEHIPAPSRPGPDLTEVGRYHPGDLVESIMNPNARIVDGPGYTDAHGLSTMPDYRAKLTISELIDLLADLKDPVAPPEPRRN